MLSQQQKNPYFSRMGGGVKVMVVAVVLTVFLYQTLRFCGLCCSGIQIRNWALSKPNFEPNSFNWQKKSENLQLEKGRCITDIEQAFSDNGQYFHSKHLTKIPKRHEKHFFFNWMVFGDKKIFSRIDCKLLLYANFTKLRGSLNWS